MLRRRGVGGIDHRDAAGESGGCVAPVRGQVDVHRRRGGRERLVPVHGAPHLEVQPPAVVCLGQPLERIGEYSLQPYGRNGIGFGLGAAVIAGHGAWSLTAVAADLDTPIRHGCTVRRAHCSPCGWAEAVR